MTAYIFRRNKAPSLLHREGQRLIDFLVSIFSSCYIAFRGITGNALIPQTQNPGLSICCKKCRMPVIHPGIHNSDQHAAPCQLQIPRFIALYLGNTACLFRKKIFKIQTGGLFYKFYLGTSGIFFQHTFRKRHNGIPAKERNHGNSGSTKQRLNRITHFTILHNNFPLSCLLLIPHIQISGFLSFLFCGIQRKVQKIIQLLIWHISSILQHMHTQNILIFNLRQPVLNNTSAFLLYFRACLKIIPTICTPCFMEIFCRKPFSNTF